jgi:hypothetical protein
MPGSATKYPKTGSTFPEKHIAIAGKGSTQEVLNYEGNPMAKMTGGSQEARVRNIYAKNGAPPIRPTVAEITPLADPSGPGIDSSQPNIVPV